VAFTRGLIAVRRSTDAFRLGDTALVARNVRQLMSQDIAARDLAVAFEASATDGTRYVVSVNADGVRLNALTGTVVRLP